MRRMLQRDLLLPIFAIAATRNKATTQTECLPYTY
jgi:hypothetical protein